MKKIPLLLFLVLLFSCESTMNLKKGSTVSLDNPESLNHAVYTGATIDEGAPNPEKIADFEERSGKKLAQVVWFLGWDQPFPATLCNQLHEAGYIPHITWEPHYWFSDDTISLDDILNGDLDTYFREWAVAIEKYGGPLFIRLMHEFNGNWYDWSVANNGKDPDKFIRAWRHVHDVLKEYNTDNVRFIWCIGQNSLPDEPWNDPVLAYPGDEYVDWIGIDGYNWGDLYEWSSWTGFDGVFESAYSNLSRHIPGKPIMICEFSCTESGGNKASWVIDLTKDLNNFPMIKSIVWFDVIKESDWKISSSLESKKAYTKIMDDDNFRTSGIELFNINVVP